MDDREKNRLAALRKYSVLDTPPERTYDDVVALARLVCAVPIALISLVDEKRQWFKAKIGLDASETPRDISFCTHALHTPDAVFIVNDAHRDPRFADNPLVQSHPHVRFYAGMPLVDSDGMPLGTLCVIDHVPRTLDEGQLQSLSTLARQVVRHIEMTYHVKQLEDSESRFLKFMDCSPAIAFVKDEQGRYVYVNKTFLDRFQLDMDDVLGKDDFQLMPYALARATRSHDLKVLLSQQTVSLVETVDNGSGSLSYWQIHKFPLTGHGLIGCVATDISTLKHYEEQLEASQTALEENEKKLQQTLNELEVLSTTDALTGLKNRRAFEALLENEWAFAVRYETPLSVLMLDLDHFKRINDTYGHPGGDKLLKLVAEILTKHNRATDSAARFGGEEFTVFLPNTRMKGARNLAERIRQDVERLTVTTISIGVASRGPATETPDDLIRAADDALYRAKRKGRNRVCLACAKRSTDDAGSE